MHKSRCCYGLIVLIVGLGLQGCAVAPVRHHTSDTHETTVDTARRAPSRTIARRGSSADTDSKSSPRPASPAPRSRGSSGYAYRGSRRSRAYRHHQRNRRYLRYRRESRPGLGTAYGESLYAPVEQVSFQRRSSRPDTLLQLHYNSPAGVYAMARYLGGVYCCGTMSSTSGSGVSLRLTDARGRSLRGLRRGGRVWVMGQHGRRYRIRLQNHTARRVEVVISVDGLDVIDGRRASVHKRGYILMPYRTLWIDGFRRSYSHVAAFRFSKVRNSYAARTSGSRNVGVVGVAVFSEVPRRWDSNELQRRLQASPFATAPE